MNEGFFTEVDLELRLMIILVLLDLELEQVQIGGVVEEGVCIFCWIRSLSFPITLLGQPCGLIIFMSQSS